MVNELIGLAATVFVLLSFLAREPRKIRKINIIGACLFVTYGARIKALSTCLLNLALIFIHIYYLRRER